MVVALVLGVAAPLDVVVFGLLAVGMVHVALEVRFVSGRYHGVLHGRFLIGVNVVLAAIVVERLVLPGLVPRRVEIVVMLAILAAAAARAEAWWPRAVGATLVLGVGAYALWAPDTWFVLQANLHNLLPAVFLWEWSTALADPRVRRAVRATTVAWAVVVPALLVSGLLDPVLSSGSTRAAETGSAVAPSILLQTSGALAPRLLAVFAFAQVMHYAIWCWYLPRHAPDATAAFEATPVGSRLRGWRLLALAGAATVVVVAVAWADYGDGRALYTSLATYHAYLEFPVLVALVTAWAAGAGRLAPRPAHAGGPDRRAGAWMEP